MKDVFVDAIRLGGEVVPHEALDGMIERLDRRLLVRVSHDRVKHLEPEDEEFLLFGGVAALHGKPEEAARIGAVEVDAERNGVRSTDREHLIAAGLLRLETHDFPLLLA
jgi:hypothetical protein